METIAIPTHDVTTMDARAAQKAGVINPYALAEVVAGRPIPWKQIPDAPRVLEDILHTPYEELFDPRFEGPLYLGLRLDEKLELVPERPRLLDVVRPEPETDLDEALEFADVATLADLVRQLGAENAGQVEVRRTERVGRYSLQVTVPLARQDELQRLARFFTPEVVRTVAHDPTAKGAAGDWTPPNGTWSDSGRFFNEAAEYFDPIQGAVANCYYIAALSAVAWAAPYRISHLTRATGTAQQRFVNMIRFYKPDSGGQLDREIEVTDAVPVNASTGNFLYCRSSEPGELWPAVYEKAYAKLATGTPGDHPDITATAWGDCVWATAQLTGAGRHYFGTPTRSADALWDLVRAHSRGGRTFQPMTAWTYSSGEATERKVVYADANLVASHCYTVLGWAYRNGRKYIVLRNPWGNTEASVRTLSGTVFLHDVSWWRPITLATVDGTFALEASAFKTYFAGLGVAK